jgi:hypothetical protein
MILAHELNCILKIIDRVWHFACFLFFNLTGNIILAINGIDPGTINSAVAVLRGGRLGIIPGMEGF